MKLSIATPLAVVVDAQEAAHVRAEDESGAFGILPGHADFLTALSVCVLTWRDTGGTLHHVAVRAGTLSVRNGDTVTVATPEAVASDDLSQLEAQVLAQFQRQAEEERTARTDSQRLRLAAIRQIIRLLRPEKGHSGAAVRVDPGSRLED